MKIGTILLVEDNPNDVELILASLKAFKLANAIDVVYDGVEAMEYLRYEGKFKKRKPGHPSVVLLDIKMPRMDGIEVLKAILGKTDTNTWPAGTAWPSRSPGPGTGTWSPPRRASTMIMLLPLRS